ncbi:leucine Rich repeat-containing domain protein [Dictyocaulus viviparus]|uniref:Leucine Rich repeat-containing domain protein n=1 Tax=Dictyocaulus viviparus TaxID=29172 RepID=A0A0D8YB92_DICVI|nr:leucine Rich repeat-containing domain protein [Dictyocaulus viviparus]
MGAAIVTLLHCLIKDISENAFEGLSQLRHLRLKRNRICALSSNALTEVRPLLELLDLSGNCLTAIPAQHLRNSVKLMYLDLSDNKITEINNFELMNLPQLKELRLHNNILNEIHPMAFMNVPQLQYLYMRDNLLGSLDGNRLQAFHKLEILDVTNNLLQKLPELKDLTNLKQVRLDGNLIGKIETLAFSNNPKLQLISIQNNNIIQIARNSFDSLDQLLVLLLSNNSIQSIGRGMLDGMRNLQQLSLRNNSLTSIDEYTFLSLRHLTTLDLAHNNLQTIAKRTFAHQTKLFWLDLSNNQLRSFTEGTFDTKIANILLDGNSLVCDDAFDWFVRYLVTNRVRTFLPFQPEISCAGPEKYAGVRLNDLMMKKANDTLNEGIKTLGLSQQGQRSFISSLIPGLRPAQSGKGGPLEQAASGIPILSTLSQAFPLMRNMPGLDGSAPTANALQPMNSNLNTAIEQFTAPLVRFATGGQPVASDIEQLIQSIPNFIVNVPGLGNVDVNKVSIFCLDPSLVAHILRGGQVPGIPKEIMDGIVQQYMTKIQERVATVQNENSMKDDKSDYSSPRLPLAPVASIFAEKGVLKNVTALSPTLPAPGFIFSKELMDTWKLLPAGYNISKIPAEIITSFSHGEVPDLSNLPADLVEYFKSSNDKLGLIFNRVTKFEKPALSTYSPYDINRLSNEMIHEDEETEKNARIRLYTAIALGLVSAATIVVLGLFAVYIKRQREEKERRSLMASPVGGTPGAPLANSTMCCPVVSTHSTQLHLRGD